MNVLLVLITVLRKEVNAQTMTVVGNVLVLPDTMVMELPVLTMTNVLEKITDTFAVPIPHVTISQEPSNVTVMPDLLIWKISLSKELLFKSVLISSIVLMVEMHVMLIMPFVTKLLV